MSFDDEDDDAVVPSGSRRSSYVPPAEQGDFVPSLPPIEDPEAVTSSSGQLPTIGAAGDDQIAQTPVFAESVEVPGFEEERTQPTGSIVIEVPAEETPVSENPAESRDQFGLPLVGEPIDIPQVVVTDPLPEAVPGTGTVFDDNRLFPPAVAGEVVEDPIVEEFGAPAADAAVELDPETVSEPENVPAQSEEPALSAPILPDRQSLTPSQLSEVLGANGGMSSNDQMALLDSQIPLREADSEAVAAFVESVVAQNVSDAQALLLSARDRFGDIRPELFAGLDSDETDSEFVDDSTPVTGIPVVEHIEIVEVIEDADGVVREIDVTEVDAVVVSEPSATPTIAPEQIRQDGQAWSLAAPADVVDTTPTKVERRGWWSATGVVATVVAAVLLAAGVSAVRAESVPSIAFVLAGIAVAVLVSELARRTSARSGSSQRAVFEELFGRISGRVLSVVAGILVLATLVTIFVPALSGLGSQFEGSAIGSTITAFVPSGSVGLALAGLALVGGAVIAALPHRLYRAKVLVLTGWTAVGTGSVVSMGAALLLATAGSVDSRLAADIAVAGVASTIALVLFFSGLAGFSEISRVRETKSGILWVSIGLGLGLVTLAGTVAGALVAADGAHYFFGLNPVVHIIAPNPILNIALGAVATVPALILVGALIFRGIATLSTRDDREDPNALLSWLLVLVPISLTVCAVLGLGPVVVDNVPSVGVFAVPVAAIAGVLAARGCSIRELASRGARRGLVAVAVVTSIVGLGFATSVGPAFEWVGFINATLRPLGYGLLYTGSVAPIATAMLSFLLSLVIVLPSARRSARVS